MQLHCVRVEELGAGIEKRRLRALGVTLGWPPGLFKTRFELC
jgi:hypothetical protein